MIRRIIFIPTINNRYERTGYTVIEEQDYPLLEYSYSKHERQNKEYVYSSVKGWYLHQLVVGEKAPHGHKIDHENSNRVNN